MKRRYRPVQLHVRVNEQEKALIDRRMERAGIHNLNTYMRKMALEGYVIHMDMTEVHNLVSLLRSVGTNVNQIARRVNETHHLYENDVEDLRDGLGRLWKALNTLLGKWEGLQ